MNLTSTHSIGTPCQTELASENGGEVGVCREKTTKILCFRTGVLRGGGKVGVTYSRKGNTMSDGAIGSFGIAGRDIVV